MQRVRIASGFFSSATGNTEKGTDLFTHERNQIRPLYNALYLGCVICSAPAYLEPISPSIGEEAVA